MNLKVKNEWTQNKENFWLCKSFDLSFLISLSDPISAQNLLTVKFYFFLSKWKKNQYTMQYFVFILEHLMAEFCVVFLNILQCVYRKLTASKTKLICNQVDASLYVFKHEQGSLQKLSDKLWYKPSGFLVRK